MKNSALICVTQKSLVQDDFILRMEKIISTRPFAIILREKDLPEDEYTKLAIEVVKICNQYEVDLFFNANIKFTVSLAEKYNCGVHTSFENFINYQNMIDVKLGVSIHSIEEAKTIATNKLNNLNHVICGHVFDTKCKENLLPRGLDFLESIVNVLNLPVFGIGGISLENIADVLKTGAKGAAIMSSLMQCSDPIKLIDELFQTSTDFN